MSSIRPNYKRKRETRPQTPLILVVCEDKNIEPAYFNKLKKVYSNILEKKGNTKTDPIKIVKRAKKERKKLLENGGLSPHSETWCVFDVDTNTQKQIYDALKLAKENNINIALSNPCIEFWFLCHYVESSRKYTSKTVLAALKKQNNCSTYSKNMQTFSQINDFLNYVSNKKNINLAIDRADKINKGNEISDNYNIKRIPSTNIIELIEKIIQEA